MLEVVHPAVGHDLVVGSIDLGRDGAVRRLVDVLARRGRTRLVDDLVAPADVGVALIGLDLAQLARRRRLDGIDRLALVHGRGRGRDDDEAHRRDNRDDADDDKRRPEPLEEGRLVVATAGGVPAPGPARAGRAGGGSSARAGRTGGLRPGGLRPRGLVAAGRRRSFRLGQGQVLHVLQRRSWRSIVVAPRPWPRCAGRRVASPPEARRRARPRGASRPRAARARSARARSARRGPRGG